MLVLWASWCRSCRVTAKSFKPLYEKYANDGFNIIGIAREYQDTAKWLKALAADDYPWLNMVAFENNHNIWTQYGIPDQAGRTILINSDGIIIKSDPTAKEVEKYLQKVLCATM